MTKDALISIIIPVYNTERYIERCLESVINQTYNNLEIIVIDDGSEDNSYRICENFSQKDNRIILLQKENGGQASARNLGIKRATGDYISFVDSDDWIESDMYEKMLYAVKDRENSIAVCGRYKVEEDTMAKISSFTAEKEITWDFTEAVGNFLTWNNIDSSTCDKLFPAKLIKEQKFSGRMVCEDMLFVYEALKKSSSVIHIGKPLYNYLQRSGSTSKPIVYNPRIEGMLIYPKQISEDVKASFPALLKHAECFQYTNYINYSNILSKTQAPLTRIYKELRKNLKNILTNPFISTECKLICTLAVTGMLSVSHKIKNMLKSSGKK